MDTGLGCSFSSTSPEQRNSTNEGGYRDRSEVRAMLASSHESVSVESYGSGSNSGSNSGRSDWVHQWMFLHVCVFMHLC